MIEFPNDKQPWMASGMCATAENPDAWFPHESHAASAAKTLCNGCPSKLPCLTYALENPELEGIWAGTTEAQRAQLRTGDAA